MNTTETTITERIETIFFAGLCALACAMPLFVIFRVVAAHINN